MKTSIQQVLNAKGVVTSLKHLGPSSLPYRMRAHQEIFQEGRSWTLQFESSPKVKDALQKTLKLDERVIRSGIVKFMGIGRSLETVMKAIRPLESTSLGNERKFL